MNCLDAETLAAWIDGGLSGAMLEDVQAHVADCARCQALVGAMGRTRAAVPAVEPQRGQRWWLAWAVPLTAAATAIAIWIAVPRQADVAAPPGSPRVQKQEATAPPEVPPPTPAAEPAARAGTLQREARAAEREEADRSSRPSTGQPANDVDQFSRDKLAENATVTAPATPPPAAAEGIGVIAGQVQARATAAPVNGFCGAAWPAPPADLAGQITAGSAPSADVCWLVGRGGIVLRSTDRQTWQRVTFPPSVDLSRVNATDARTATVVSIDGRTFSTSDGGVTWTQP